MIGGRRHWFRQVRAQSRPRARGGCRAGRVLAIAALLAVGGPVGGEQLDPIRMLGVTVAPGTSAAVALTLTESYAGAAVQTPVTVIHGAAPGPVVCLTGGVHGDEVIGIEIVRRVLERVQPAGLRGTVIGVPIANVPAFRRGSRYLPDRRDLNRYFPGSRDGSLASRVAHALFDNVVRHCDALLDFHSGSSNRTNEPQVRGNTALAGVRRLMNGFGGVAIHHEGGEGTLRRAATDAGIAALVFEAGEAGRFHEPFIAAGAAGAYRVLSALGLWAQPVTLARTTVFQGSAWVRAEAGGILLDGVALGTEVASGDVLAVIVDPLNDVRTPVSAPFPGRVIGRALNQLVMPGFGLFHLATLQRTGEDEAIEAEQQPSTD